jgi:predicted Rossmann-fold nucleotide-binding protein
MEILSWRQLGFHNKPLALYDVNGFYQPFKALVEAAIDEKFVAPGFDAQLLRLRLHRDNF